MKTWTSSLIIILVILALGALAVATLPRGMEGATAAAPVEVAAPNAAKWNAIVMALDSTSTIPDAQALASAIPGTTQILRWNASLKNFTYYIPNGGGGTNFSTLVGEPYFVQLNNTAGAVFSVVGDVPPQSGQPGAVQFNLVGGSPCKWNYISLPLDKSTITTAQTLADAIGNVGMLLVWDASIQNFTYYIPNGGGGTNFATKIGYPYWVCMNTNKSWPLN